MIRIRINLLLWIIMGVSVLMLVTPAFSVNDWESADIGLTDKGSTEIKGDVFTIRGNGADIWANADAFRYVYQETSGDFEISAHIVSQERADPWSKTGLMIRQSLEPDSQNVFINVTPDNGTKMILRETPGAGTGPSPLEQNFKAPIWLKLVRKGDEFSSFWSQDGKNWDPADVVGTPSVAEVAMTDPVFVGIAVSSHAAGVLAESVIDNVKGGGDFSLPVEPSGSVFSTWAGIKLAF